MVTDLTRDNQHIYISWFIALQFLQRDEILMLNNVAMCINKHIKYKDARLFCTLHSSSFPRAFIYFSFHSKWNDLWEGNMHIKIKYVFVVCFVWKLDFMCILARSRILLFREKRNWGGGGSRHVVKCKPRNYQLTLNICMCV